MIFTSSVFKKFSVKLFVCLLCLLLTSCGSDKSLAPLNHNDVILAFGDSLTAGTGASQGNDYPSQLAQLTGFEVINAGIPGDQTQDGLRRIDEALTRHQPALVILCLGGNDFLRKKNKEAVQQNLITLIEKIQQSNAQVLLVAVPEPALFLSDSDLFNEVAEQMNVPLLDDLLTDLLSDSELKSDTIHLNNQGYQLFAAGIQEKLQQLGAF
ncbi:GDSL-type esterase/lipase family protein [Pleionea sp. CnH1-48]|uniref:GDSL-type esterase/lipase family protein n=1 Tax=Pleionea sp. CnH1-48 TaxID=2954494 RepID=UPI002097FF52|nr:GDSL-type esterase/lipase family protein [Pleionea sp. CnH1-48]MCO7227250.1 GDSL-type esterase/lipase family protein [Pleionea sp. CnH1-48]